MSLTSTSSERETLTVVQTTLTRRLPKCELHVHLTGCVRDRTLNALLSTKGVTSADLECLKNENWDDAMNIFSLIHRALDNVDAYKRVLWEAIEDMHDDGVVYVEFRVGLKRMPTKSAYLKSLLHVVRSSRTAFPNIAVKLIVSMARHDSIQAAQETATAAIECFETDLGRKYLCGVELGGNPNRGRFRDFQPIFERCRRAGMKVALHFAENRENEAEHRAMLDFSPDRLGHAVFMSTRTRDQLLSTQIPVETCLSCHDEFYGVPIRRNIFAHLFPREHPVSLNCDNPFLQKTSPSKEYAKAIVNYPHLLADVADLERLVLGPFNHTFSSPEIIRPIRSKAKEAMQTCASAFSSLRRIRTSRM